MTAVPKTSFESRLAMKLYPVILSGGVGSRLWPASRAAHPKQLHALVTANTMMQETAARVRGETAGGTGFHAPVVVCNERHAEAIASQLDAVGAGPSAVIAEPVGRNTAPAAALAALAVAEQDPEGIMLLLPADHHITDVGAFHDAIDRAAQLAQGGRVVTYGIVPTKAETGYGYIRKGEALAETPGSFAIAKFEEKPKPAVARDYFSSGEYFWNGGIFTVRSDVLLREMERHCPGILSQCRAALEKAERTNRLVAPCAETFGACEADSIDYAIMERTEAGAVVSADMGWSDVGSWTALYEVAEKDGQGNVLTGDVLVHDTHNSYVRSETRLVAVVGVDDLVVVETKDAVLITTRDKAQGVKAIVDRLKADKRGEL